MSLRGVSFRTQRRYVPTVCHHVARLLHTFVYPVFTLSE